MHSNTKSSNIGQPGQGNRTGVNVYLCDDHGNEIEEHDNPYFPQLQNFRWPVWSRLICSPPRAQVKVMLHFDEEYEPYSGDGVKITVAVGYGEQAAGSLTDVQVWWIPKDKLDREHEFAYMKTYREDGSLHNEQALAMPAQAGGSRTASKEPVWLEGFNADKGCITVFVVRGKLSGNKPDPPSNDRERAEQEGGIIRWDWCNDLRSENGTPLIFDFRNMTPDALLAASSVSASNAKAAHGAGDGANGDLHAATAALEASSAASGTSSEENDDYDETYRPGTRAEMHTPVEVLSKLKSRKTRMSLRNAGLPPDGDELKTPTKRRKTALEKRSPWAHDEDDDEELPIKRPQLEERPETQPTEDANTAELPVPNSPTVNQPTPGAKPRQESTLVSNIARSTPPTLIRARDSKSTDTDAIDLTGLDDIAIKQELADVAAHQFNGGQAPHTLSDEEDEEILRLRLEANELKQKLRLIERKKLRQAATVARSG